jgi:hypothetical protein
MDGSRFDRWTRRRFGLAAGGVAGTLLGPAMSLPGETTAEKRRRRRSKKPKKNAFGCVNVGKPCRGKDSLCCSGRCQGKAPKKGEKDKSRCAAHHVGPCTAAQNECGDDTYSGCNPDLPSSACYRTTGEASFCGNAVVGGCIDCRKDADCEAYEFPKGSACVKCPACESGEKTACISPGAP